MWPISLPTLLALPLLGIAAIPLILSAWVTISIALFALIIRLSVVYIEIAFSLIVNYFIIPTSSTSSLLTFSASEPTTPAPNTSRRISSYGLLQSRRSSDPLLSENAAENQDERVIRKKSSYARNMAEAHHLALASPFPGFFFSGDERRDFEGVGGWRSYPDSSLSAKLHGFYAGDEKSPSPPSLVTPEGGIDPDIDADERAWLSLNNRLELPSHLITLGSSSAAASALDSFTQIDPRHSHFQALAPAASSQGPEEQGERRRHQRSITTSSLTTSDRRTGSGLSISLSTRPDYTAHFSGTSSRPLSPLASRAPILSSASHIQPPSTSEGVITSLGSSSSGLTSGSGGYFALQRPGSSATPNQGGVGSTSPTAPGTAEDREASWLHLARFIPHYPTSVRHRRESSSGPNSKTVLNGERG